MSQELGPHHLTRAYCTSATLHLPRCLLEHLLFVLVMCYSPFCRKTRRGRESIVSVVQSIHNSSRDLLNSSFSKSGFLLQYEDIL